MTSIPRLMIRGQRSCVRQRIPYLAIYFIVKEILSVWPNIAALNTAQLFRYGWAAFGGVVLNILLYFAALVCSHLAAFGTLYELKVNFATHLARVPLGFHVIAGSGKLRKIMDENIEKIEGFIAHELPDMVAAFVAPVVMIIILLTVDWRLGLAALVGVAIAFALYASLYGNENAQKMMREYQAKEEEMNNATVEYIRGISVVKAFKADKIIVLDQGEAVEEGTHDSLMAAGGLYKRLYTIQQESLGWSV